MRGEVTISPAAGARLRYHEDGRMRLPGGGEVDAYADYLLATIDGRLTLLFPETPPRLFQSFALSDAGDHLAAESLHDCAPDRYRSRIAFQPDDTWSLSHHVTGPRKAYVSTTRYRRR